MNNAQEQRKYSRIPTENYQMRVYTSVVRASYSVPVSDLSMNGAFLKTQHLPKEGEIITFELFDSYMRTLYSGNARVVRLHRAGSRNERGFGILFNNVLKSDFLDGIDLHN